MEPSVCTLIVGVQLWPKWPLVVAANRDEALDRPAEAPRVRVEQGVRILAPRDVRAQGTWLGMNEHEVFVAITNRFGAAPDPGRASRGDLVLSALTARSAHEAAAQLANTDPAAYNGFHLVMADRDGAFLVFSDAMALHTRTLEPGWHVITERSFDAAPTRREPMIHRVLEGWQGALPSEQELQSILTARDEDGFEGVLVSVPAHNYGTRSATLVRLPKDGPPEFAHADGPPDITPFVSYAVRDLLAAPQR